MRITDYSCEIFGIFPKSWIFLIPSYFLGFYFYVIMSDISNFGMKDKFLKVYQSNNHDIREP